MNFSKLPLEAVFVGAVEKSSNVDAPLLIVLHGRGDSPDGFSWMPSALDLPKLNYLFLQAPDPYYVGYSWYDLSPNQLTGILRSRKLLEETFAQIFNEGYSPQNCILFGFSQGCLLTLEFGGRFATKLRGYIGVSGYVFDAEVLASEANPAVKKADWLVTHGTKDEVLEVTHTREQVKRLQENGFSIDYREYPKSHTIDEMEELPFLREWINARI